MTPGRPTTGRVARRARSRRMDPRISARRTAVIKEQGRRRLIIAGVALGVAALVVGGWFLLHTPLFSARSVTVTGNVHETAAEVVAQAGLAGHPPLLDVNAGAAAARLEQLPWVRTATVHVSWPDGVHIAVTEETPRFTASHAGGQVGVAQQRRPGAGAVGHPPAGAPAPDRARAPRPARHGALRPRTRPGSGSPRRCRPPSSGR